MDADKMCDGMPTGEPRVRIEGGVAHVPGLAGQRNTAFRVSGSPERPALVVLVDQADFLECTPSATGTRADARISVVDLTINDRSGDIRVVQPIGNPTMARLLSIVRRRSKRPGGVVL